MHMLWMSCYGIFLLFFTYQDQSPHLLWALQYLLPQENRFNALRSTTLTLGFALYHCKRLQASLPHAASANLGCQYSAGHHS